MNGEVEKIIILYFSPLGIDVSISQENKRYRVTIGVNVYCTCTPSQRADRKTCCHAVWVFQNLFEVSDDDATMAQISLDEAKIRSLHENCPNEVPENLARCLQKEIKRHLHPRLVSHPSRDAPQYWMVDRRSGKAVKCSGCLQKDIIKTGMIHLRVEGGLLVLKNEMVVQPPLRFCAKAKCVTNIKSKFNNVRNLTSMEVKVEESFQLAEEERSSLLQKGFILKQ